ncbi:MAG: HD domain-containing phosphohydrolase [Thermodesulfobacteriota bacterium]
MEKALAKTLAPKGIISKSLSREQKRAPSKGQQGQTPQDDTSGVSDTLSKALKGAPSHPTKGDKVKAFAKALEEPSPGQDSEDRPKTPSETQEVPISKGQETSSSRPARMDKAKAFAKALEEPSPGQDSEDRPKTPSETQEVRISKGQETSSLRPARMDKARAFAKALEEPSADQGSFKEESESGMSIAELIQKTTAIENDGSEHVKKEESLKVDVQQELISEEEEVARLYYDTVEAIKPTIRDVEKERPVAVELLELQISRLSDKLIFKNPKLLALSTENGRTDRNNGEPFEFHLMNASIIAMNIGFKLGYNKSKLVELGIAALFHDIGLLKIRDLIDSDKRLDKKAFNKVKKHPAYGAKMLKKSRLPEIYIQAVLQHHEREDGSGYPYGFKGHRIHEYAKIAGLADIVEALGQRRPHRPALPIHEAVKKTVENWNDRFEARIVKALVKALGVYPVGTVVELSSKEVGKVIKTVSTSPLRPIVQVFRKTNGEVVKPRIIDLSQETNIHIKEAIDEGEKVMI